MKGTIESGERAGMFTYTRAEVLQATQIRRITDTKVRPMIDLLLNPFQKTPPQ